MRILEIMTTPTVYDPRDTTVDRETEKFLKTQKPKTAASTAKDQLSLGSGEYATTYDTPRTPTGMNIVTKIHRVQGPWRQDGYLNYLRELQAITQDHPNPYLPQIYSVARKGTDERVAVIQMEKLRPIMDLTTEQLKNIFIKLGQGSTRGFELPKLGSKMDHIQYLKKLEYWITETANYPREHQWLDPDFLEACAIIHRLEQYDEGLLDIHLGNIMYRATPYGPQMVITDPLT